MGGKPYISCYVGEHFHRVAPPSGVMSISDEGMRLLWGMRVSFSPLVCLCECVHVCGMYVFVYLSTCAYMFILVVGS